MNASTVKPVDPAVFGDGSGYPARTWTVAPSPSAFGWSEEKLAEARQLSDHIESDAVVIVDQGIVVEQWGEVARKHLVQYYNNWDFNALGTIFEQRTGIGIYDALEQRLGRPLQMQDFTADNGRHYDQETLSAHPVYHFAMSARDMARFGLLYLRRGRWRGRQLIPAAWIDRSTTPYSDVGDERRGYGYMWWIGKAEAFGGHALYMARGGDGHAIYVVPALDVVVVHRIDRLTFASGWDEVDQLLVVILKAHPRDGASR